MAKRQVGKVTGVTTAGGGLGAALAQIIVEFVPRLAEVESAVTVVLTVSLALVAGFLVPPDERERVQQVIYGPSYPSGDDGDLGPDEADTDMEELDLEAGDQTQEEFADNDDDYPDDDGR